MCVEMTLGRSYLVSEITRLIIRTSRGKVDRVSCPLSRSHQPKYLSGICLWRSWIKINLVFVFQELYHNDTRLHRHCLHCTTWRWRRWDEVKRMGWDDQKKSLFSINKATDDSYELETQMMEWDDQVDSQLTRPRTTHTSWRWRRWDGKIKREVHAQFIRPCTNWRRRW